jgi:YD repeat-containing protein
VTLSARPYIVVLSGKSPVTPATIGAAGGSLLETAADHLVVDLPPDGVELLRHDPGVKYLQLVGEVEERSPEAPATPSRARAEWAPPTWSSGAYNYDGTGNIYAIGTASSLASDGTRNTYTYDMNSRLATWTGPGSWSESYTYDVYGNMTAKTMGASTMNMPVTTATNHLNAESYDIAGNRTSSSTSPSHTYAYDSVSMMVKDQEGSSAASWYVYTADDERIGVLNSDAWTWSDACQY